MRPGYRDIGPKRLRSAALHALCRLPAAFVAMLLGVPLLSGSAAPAVSAAAPGFAFNWIGAPSAAQPWVPAPANDWDLLLTSIDPTNEVKGGTFPAGHGADCGAPPATHP